MKKCLILISSLVVFSCSRDNNINNCNFLLDVSVNTTINLNLPQFSQLINTGNPVKIEGLGNGGIIVIRVNSQTIRAWDGADPSRPFSNCSVLTINGVNAESDCGEDIVYNLITGQSIGQNQQPCTLKEYRADFVGNNQYIITN